MSEERVHHPYSPSSLQSLEACPCYKSRSSDHVRTIIGTIAHKSTETRTDDARLDDDDASAVAECMDFYDGRKIIMEEIRKQAIEARAVELWGRIAQPGDSPDAHVQAAREIAPVVELLETYLEVDECYFNDGTAEKPDLVRATTGGYVDRVILNHDRTYAELFDWKFGLWPIEVAENNLQGIAYVLGLFRRYPTLQSAKFFFKQPLIHSIQEATFTREQIPGLYLRVQTVVARAREARRLMKLGDWSFARPMVPACNFCANIGRCPKVAEFACRVGSKFFPLEIPEDITPSKIHSPKNTTLGMRLCAVVAVWAKSYRTVITDRVIRGDAEPPADFEITTRSEREIKDQKKYEDIALQYLTKQEYDATLSVTFGSVEKKISEKAPRGQKTATVDEFKQKLLDQGAVEHGPSYSFLKATSTKTTNKTE